MKNNLVKLTLKIREKIPIIFLFLFFFWLFFNLLSSHMLFPGKDGWYSSGSTWGDLAFHLSLISSFAWGENSLFSSLNFAVSNLAASLVGGGSSLPPPTNPVYFGERISYPFLPDLFSSLLVKSGLSLRQSLILPSLFFLMILVILIYLLTLKITKSKFGAFIAPLIFFFNGSIFAVYYFWQDFKESHLSFFSFLQNLQKEYAHLADYNLKFSNIICDYLLPQRAIIWGLILGILTIYFFWQYFENKERKNLLKAGITAAFLPLIHTHSFLTMVLIAGFLVIIQFIQKPKSFKKIFSEWLYFALPIIIIALPQVLWLFPFNKEGFFRLQFGWMKGQDNIFWFWLKNLGIHFPLIILAFFAADRKLKIFYLPFLGLFLISNLIIFQPNDYDNMKIMIFWFLLSCILIVNFFQQILNRFSLKGLFIILPIFLLLTVMGILSVYREALTKWLMFSKEDIEIAKFIRENTPKNTLFLTSDKHNHLVPTLTGREILMGYRGWLWTYGIHYQEREKDILTIFSGKKEAKNLLKKYKIDYVFMGSSERLVFSASDQFFDQNFTLFFKSGDTKIYKIK